MKKALMIATAAGFLGATTLASTPASAMFPFLPLVIAAKQHDAATKAAPAKKAKRVSTKKKAKNR